MSKSETSIERECRIFTQYLIGCPPSDYVSRKYLEAHRVLAPVFSKENRFDFFLVRVARTHPTLTKLADSYTRVFVRKSLLRKKLVLALAILETCSPSSHVIDAVDPSSKRTLLIRFCSRGFVSIASAMVAAIVFLPVQLIFATFETSSDGLERVQSVFSGADDFRHGRT
jgi:hypothetical protein